MQSVKAIVKALDDKKASRIDVLDLTELTSMCDYFIICSCQSSVQVRACVDNVEEELEKLGVLVSHKEGYRNGNWILMDYGHIIVHVMQEETRDFYSLEKLWDDAPRIDVTKEN